MGSIEPIIWRLWKPFLVALPLALFVAACVSCSGHVPSGIDPKRDLQDTLADYPLSGYPVAAPGAVRLRSYKTTDVKVEQGLCTISWEADVAFNRRSGQFPQIQTWRGTSRYELQGNSWVHVGDEHSLVSFRPYSDE